MGFFTQYKLLLELLAFATLLAAIAVGVHKFLSYEQQLGYDRRVAEEAVQNLKAERAAREKEANDAKQKEIAENERTLQGQRIEALAAALATASASLRGTSSSAIRNLSSASAETAAKTAVAFSGVFQDCTDRYAELAKKADGHVADVRLLQASP